MSLTDAQRSFALGDFDPENYSDKALFRLAKKLERTYTQSLGSRLGKFHRPSLP